MRQLHIPALMLATIMSAGCSSPAASDSDDIIGRWKWLWTEYGWSETERPKSGEVHITEFAPDGTFTVTVNRRLQRKGKYSITPESDSKGQLLYDGIRQEYEYYKDGNRLYIQQAGIADGQVIVFTRIR